MECKELYTKNNIDYGCGKLYGPFPLIKDYSFSTNKKGMKTIIPIKDNNYIDLFYAEMDEYSFFYDVIHYGQLLYEVFKDNINHLPRTWVIPQSFEKSYINIISEQILINNFSKIESICFEFLKKYTPGVVFQRYFPIEYKATQGIPLSFMINHILLIFMLHTIFANLSTGFNQYTEIYNAFSINENDTDSEVLDKIIEYINIYSLPYYHIMSFNFEILRIDNNIIPITITPNIFTFAFEVLQNNVAARSFYSFDEYNDVHSYIGFRKCSRCLKNMADLDMERQTQLVMPVYKRVYCDECRKELKRIASNKYEHSIREIYDELKKNVNKCNPNLANEIRNLKPKDKETKSHLMKLYNQYKNDSK